MATIGIIFIIIIVITVLALALLAYFLIYRRHVNKALKQDPEAPRKEMAHPRHIVLSVSIILLAITCIINTVTLASDYNYLSSQYDLLNLKVSEFEERIIELEEAAENCSVLFESLEMQAVSLDEKTGVFTLRFNAVPKITSDVTITAECDGKSYTFEKQEDCYTALVEYSFPEEAKSFADADAVTDITLSVKAGETVFSEKKPVVPGDIISLFFLTVDDETSVTFEPNKEGGYDASAWVSVQMQAAEQRDGIGYSEISLVTAVDGTVVSSIVLTNGHKGIAGISYGYFGDQSYSIEASENSDISVYLKLTADDGYIFEIPCTFLVKDADGNGCTGCVYSANLVDSDPVGMICCGNPAKEAVKGIILPDGSRLK